MATWDGNNYYYSGQGVVLVGERDALGKPKNMLPVGNVSALSISVETAVIEHKEAQTGQRGIDLRLTTETKCALSMTMENFNAKNLKLALRGDLTEKAAGSVTDEALSGSYPGGILPLQNIKVSSLVVRAADGTTALTAYTNDSTPYDYKVNSEAGSIQINDGSVVKLDKMGSGAAVSAISTATQAVVSVTNTAAAGDYITFTGVTGTNASDLNGKWFKVVSATSSTATINYDSTGKTFTYTTAKAAFTSQDLEADYSYAAQNVVEALTQGAQERYMRFEGLNTADGNNPVVIEVFKFSVDPLQELSLISDEVQQFVLQGNVLSDPLQVSGSKFFRERQLR